MAKEQLRIKVAEACGWEAKRIENQGILTTLWCWWNKGLKRPACRCENHYSQNDAAIHLPNYPEDLNACAEFEKTLDQFQGDKYMQLILEERGGLEHNTPFDTFRATAEQRCIAFLKMKGVL